MAAPSLGRVGAKITCPFPPSRLNLSQLAKQAKKRSICVKRWLISDILKPKQFFSTETILPVLLWARIQCTGNSLITSASNNTLCANSSSLGFSSSCLCAHTKRWLTPSPRPCRHQHSSGMDTSWLVVFLLPLAFYVASGADFERWLWALRFHIVFRLIDFVFFFSPPTLRPEILSCVWFLFLRFLVNNFFPSFFHNSLFSCWFAQYCLFKIPLLCMGESDTASMNEVCRRASSEQRPRTRSCHK